MPAVYLGQNHHMLRSFGDPTFRVIGRTPHTRTQHEQVRAIRNGTAFPADVDDIAFDNSSVQPNETAQSYPLLTIAQLLSESCDSAYRALVYAPVKPVAKLAQNESAMPLPPCLNNGGFIFLRLSHKCAYFKQRRIQQYIWLIRQFNRIAEPRDYHIVISNSLSKNVRLAHWHLQQRRLKWPQYWNFPGTDEED